MLYDFLQHNDLEQSVVKEMVDVKAWIRRYHSTVGMVLVTLALEKSPMVQGSD
ncbi:capsid assembly protein [Salmonella phage 19]|nr:capsid assembly protein [Salmonella phage 19]